MQHLTFRRGWQPERAGYVQLRYQTVSIEGAQRAWARLTHHGQPRSHEIAGSRTIATAMGVSTQTSARYRRLFHGLGLVVDLPGRWNPEPIEDSDDNLPARVRLLETSADALCRSLKEFGGQPQLYVASRSTAGPVDNGFMAHFVRGPDRREFWSPHPGRQQRWPPTVSHEVNNSSKSGTVYRRETTCWARSDRDSRWQAVPPLPPVVVDCETSAVEGTQLWAVPTGIDFTVPDLMTMLGCSRATANRRVTEWLATGSMVRTARGVYLRSSKGETSTSSSSPPSETSLERL